MPFRIITHNGKAHLDELLASSLLAVHRSELPTEIIRLDSQEASSMAAEGNIPENTFFVDCGLVFDSGRNLFDHHQDRELDSSALLVFDKYFTYLSGSDFHEYIKLVSKVDTQGAKSLDDFELIGESKDYFSFPLKLILRAFENDPVLIVSLFAEGIKDRIRFEQLRIKSSFWLKEEGNVEITEVDSLKILKYNKRPPASLVSSLRAEDTRIIDYNKLDAVYSFDEKNDSNRILFRTNHGYDNLDFSSSCPAEPVFCHQGGFLLKFSPSGEDEWMKLIREAKCRG